MKQPLHPAAGLFTAYRISAFIIRFFQKIVFSLLFILLVLHLTAQNQIVEDSLKKIVTENAGDTNTYNALVRLAGLSNGLHSDSSFQYAQQGFLLAKKFGDEKREADCLLMMGNLEIDYIQSIQYLLNALNIYESLGD